MNIKYRTLQLSNPYRHMKLHLQSIPSLNTPSTSLSPFNDPRLLSFTLSHLHLVKGFFSSVQSTSLNLFHACGAPLLFQNFPLSNECPCCFLWHCLCTYVWNGQKLKINLRKLMKWAFSRSSLRWLILMIWRDCKSCPCACITNYHRSLSRGETDRQTERERGRGKCIAAVH